MNRPSLVSTSGRPAPYEQEELVRRRHAAFQDAKRHSRRVYFLRRVLPALGGITVILTALWLWFDPLRYVRELPVQVGALKISGTKLTMEAPRLNGFSKDGSPYTITAASAAQDLTKTSVIELTRIVGKFTRDDRGETVLTARRGVYDSKEEKMHLYGGIDIKSGEYSGKLNDAVGEPKKGHLVTENPVSVIFTDGNLRSDRLEVFDHGKSAVFEGNVVLNLKDSEIRLNDDGETAPKTAKPKKKKE